jgi:hypothetical protein
MLSTEFNLWKGMYREFQVLAVISFCHGIEEEYPHHQTLEGCHGSPSLYFQANTADICKVLAMAEFIRG